MALETVTFHSKHAGLRLVRQPGVPNRNAFGNQQGWAQQSVVYEFQSQGHNFGVLTKKKGADVIADGPLDDDGNPTEQDAIGWIRNHPQYNMSGVVGGFTEVGREPGRVPAPDDVLDDISAAGVEGDVEALEAIIDSERAGYQRDIVIQNAERTLGRVRKLRDPARATEKKGPLRREVNPDTPDAQTRRKPNDGKGENSL